MNENSYKKETLSLFRTLESAGFRLISVSNGEYQTNRAKVTLETFLEETMACDEATLRVANSKGEGRALFLVYGNGPGELVCDYTDAEDLSEAVDAFYQANS